jgi:hypothetical protein
LIAKDPELPFLVPSQTVRAKQAVAIMVNGRDWPPAFHRCAHNLVNISRTANSGRSRITAHTFRLLVRATTLTVSIFYNTVVLDRGWRCCE